ncbi:MAG: hypothetical protein HRT67_08915 [Flavobacteriaceae bacterium]|nr:hypothetical protein [Flavobacteriaceae bacterium]
MDAENSEVALSGTATPVVNNCLTFDAQAFGFGFNQSAEGTFNFPVDMSSIRAIKMHLQIDCPSACYDHYAASTDVVLKK